MTQHEEAIYVFAFRYALNRGTAAPSIVIGEILRRIDEINPQFIDQFISDTAHDLRHGLCDDLCKYEWASFLNKLLLHRDGKPSVDGFEFLESRMYMENEQIFRIEAYQSLTDRDFMYVLKRFNRHGTYDELDRRTGGDPMKVYDEVREVAMNS